MFDLRKLALFLAFTLLASTQSQAGTRNVTDYFMVSGKPVQITVLTGADFRALALAYNDWRTHAKSQISDYTITFARRPGTNLDYITFLPRRERGAITLGCATKFATEARYVIDALAGKIVRSGLC